MKLLATIALLLVVSAFGQTLSEPKWTVDGRYWCPIHEVCRTPTQKEIDGHSFAGTLPTGINWVKIDNGPCGSSFVYDAKTNTCWMTISFTMQRLGRVTCSPLQESHDHPDTQTMKCSFTPKKAKP